MPSASAAEPPRRRATALALMLASGFAGLGYQIVWTQQSGLWLGHEAAAVLAVVAAFFGGLALGAWALGPRIERSTRPARWYAGCEALIALWGLGLIAGLPRASAALLPLIGVQPSPVWQWSVAFLGCFALLLPATAAMGATLPAMVRVCAGLGQRGGSLAALYAANTAGAVLGVLACSFLLIPSLGLARSGALCVALNLLCAALAWRMPDEAAAPAKAKPPAPRRLLLTLWLSGLLGIGYELLVVRVLSQLTENTVYTFALLLAVYLIGTALGAAAWQRASAKPQRRPDAAQQRLLVLLAACCLLGSASLWAAEWLQQSALAALQPALGSNAALTVEALLALAAFGLPTFAMGALFSQLSNQAQDSRLGFSRALAVNTLGAALAPLLFGVLLAPQLGAKAALLLLPAAYLLLAGPTAWRGGATLALAVLLSATALLAPPLVFVELPAGGRVLSYREGLLGAVSVVQDAQGVARLRINNRQQEGSSASALVDGRQALLPLLLHPAPQRLLFLGLGTGVTASTAARDGSLQVDAVELLPEVIEASALFRAAPDAPRPRTLAADARRYVRIAPTRYDLVIADNFHPARSGSAALYTVEHFQAVRQRLEADGLFCQWLPLHQLDLQSLRSIVRAFLTVFPQSQALLASHSLQTPVLGLLGTAGPAQARSLAALRERLARSAVQPADYGLDEEMAVLGSVIAGPNALARFAGDAPANSDDRPLVAYLAPRLSYAPDSTPAERLLALLQALPWKAKDFPGLQAGSADSLRLAAYARAQRHYLQAGAAVRPSADVRAMLAQVREPLLQSLSLSPDFSPAYEPLLRMAQALAAQDRPAAAALLRELQSRQPARAEAAELLRSLEAAPR